jgi:hypothetical protein
LPQPLLIGGEITVATLPYVRRLLRYHLPSGYRQHPHWGAVARDLEAAASGGDACEVALALMLAFGIEGIACRPAGK